MVKTKDPQEIWATGRRKCAVARVRLKPGKGDIVINGQNLADFCQRKMLELKIMEPFELTKSTGHFDLIVNSCGGGKAGQAGAVRHGIARALCSFDEKLRSPLKKAGMLTRDPREKERKKYGRKRARRGYQWTKR
ncbi:MAG: 30S ribosomal protein S9 [Firmicutes bacterium]|nr:30S ribosomal protein S9 [Bacillota bacterium]